MVMHGAVPSIYGSLVINADKADDYSVGLLAEGTNSVLSVADTCNVTIYSGTKAAVYTSDNLTDKPIRDNGTLKENVSYNVSHPLEISRISIMSTILIQLIQYIRVQQIILRYIILRN